MCKKGCFYCCKEKIAITDDEWKYIRQAIIKLDNKEKKKIRKCAINSVNLLSMNNLQFDFNLKYDYDRFNKFDEKSYNKEYFKLNLICPLLSDDNACLIYKSRPLTCIMYRNYGLTIDCKYNNGFNTYNFQEYSIWGDYFLQLKNKKAEKIKLLVNWIYDEKL